MQTFANNFQVKIVNDINMGKATIGDRIVDFVNKMGMSPFEFSAKLGYTSTSEYSRIRNGKPVSEVVIRKILKAFPEMSRDWLVHGKGEPNKNESESWIREPEIEYRSHRKVPEIKEDTNGRPIPKLDVDVYASIIPSLSDAVTLKPSAFINIPVFSQGELAVGVSGHSMKGLINHGDWVVIKKLTHMSGLVPGEAHLIVTKADNIKTIKFIKKSDKAKHIKLVPYNTEQFDPYDVALDDILEIWRIIGLFRVLG